MARMPGSSPTQTASCDERSSAECHHPSTRQGVDVGNVKEGTEEFQAGFFFGAAPYAPKCSSLSTSLQREPLADGVRAAKLRPQKAASMPVKL